MTTAPLFTSDDVEFVRGWSCAFGPGRAAQFTSLADRIQRWLDQQPSGCPIIGCTDQRPHLHYRDETADLSPGVWSKLLDETNLSEG